MKKLQLKLRKSEKKKGVGFEVKGVINAGYCGRDQDQVLSHIQELEEEGVEPPDEIPEFYPLSPYMLTTDSCIEVAGEKTSGEVEYVILIGEEDIFITVGSDHTDRKLEKVSVSASKQVVPNILGTDVWKLTELENKWDQLVLKSYMNSGSQRIKYQEDRLAELLSPRDLIRRIQERVITGKLAGLVIFSGTIPLSTGEVVYGNRFEAILHDPISERDLTIDYRYRRFSWLT